MNLTLLGLILSFLGSVILIVDSYLGFGKLRTSFIPIKWTENGKPIKFAREEKVYDKDLNKGWGGYKKVKISKEELILIFSLSLISLGFLLQLIGYFL